MSGFWYLKEIYVMAKLTLYTNPQSRGQIAHWMMEEIGEPYETIWLEYGEVGT